MIYIEFCSDGCVYNRYLWEVHVAVGYVLGLVVAVGRVCNASVVLLHGLVLGEG